MSQICSRVHSGGADESSEWLKRENMALTWVEKPARPQNRSNAVRTANEIRIRTIP